MILNIFRIRLRCSKHNTSHFSFSRLRDKMWSFLLFISLFVNTRAGDWNMVFRATAGNGHNVYKAWVYGTGTSGFKPTDMERSCGPHYRSPLIKTWDWLGIRKVKLAFFEHGKQVAYIIFNGRNSDSMNWFSKKRVLYSSWCDLHPDHDYNMFSIEGDQRTVDRSFYINFNYGGCDADRGHIATIDTTEKRVCSWDIHPVYPQFVYSKINHADTWNKLMFGRADYMAVFIETN